MALHLYRRHRRDCKGGHPEDSRCGEFEERRKGWKRCECVIYVSGTLAGRLNRRPTGKTSWEDARACLTALEAARVWDESAEGTTPSAPSQPAASNLLSTALAPAGELPPATRRSRVTIAKAIDAFLATKQAMVAYPTFRKHRTFTKQLRVFAEGEGYIMLDQLRPEDLDIFYARGTLGPRAKAKMLEWLRSFFQYAVNREWLPKSPVSRDLKPPKGATRPPNKVPFTDEQLEDIIKACDQVEFRTDGVIVLGRAIGPAKISKTLFGF